MQTRRTGHLLGFPLPLPFTSERPSDEAADDLDAILAKLDRYQRDGLCGRITPQDCSLAPTGTYQGFPYAFVVKLENGAVAGADRLEGALESLRKLQASGSCFPARPVEACQLLGPGNYSGFPYRYRVALGSAVFYGTDDYSAANGFIQQLRSARLCY